ncbi:MAG TPA: M56 family metallopeptidase [Mediterranea massiliensis]|uniref:M56 family metallopeptidase n=1 Tax=Mediterranea massiliensis TaxID=1841865 RepID=A0A921HW43_9BACT|nr:M56 family metallopeptidase [Mediterranea massiliensis]HJF91981.1 M56 family metallopeptidase [Mediterranea massiliensis]
MGAFLFYLFKSTLCLVVLYLLFRLCFRGDTLFRTNRFLLLGGTAGCLLLPLVQVDVQQDSLWQRPVAAVEAVLTEPFVEETSVSGPLSETETVLKVSDGIGGEAMTLRSETSFGWVHLLAALYAGGAVLTLGSFLLSHRRMRQLVRRCPVRECGGCRLVIGPRGQQSFSWGRIVVLSQEDYEQNRETVLLHERMHLHYCHTADLLWMELLIVLHWFNPAAWLLMRELREVHEFEADRGVLSHGIDATQYQLLLVKKSVGTRLYSMASGFGHSKLKQRINMMLKKRTNRLARLKLLLLVPVVSGTLYVFARPEVKNAVEQVVKPQVCEPLQDTVRQDERELLEQYFARKFREGGGTVAPALGEAAHTLFVNMKNQIMIDRQGAKTDCADFIRKHLTEALQKDYQQAKQSGQPFRSDLQIRYDRGTTTEAMRLYLCTVKEVYQQLRREVAAELGTTDEAALDKAFPILVTFAEPKQYKKIVVDATEKLPLEVTLLASGQSKTLKNFSLDELRKEMNSFRPGKSDMTISLKVDKDIPMGVVQDVKEELRKGFKY